MTPAEAARAFRLFDDKLQRKVIGNAIRRGVRAAAAAALKRVRERGLGRALWTNRNSKRKGISGTPPLIVRASRVKRSGPTWSAGITAHGVAALIQTGGRIKPHKITAKLAKRLVFKLGDRWIATKSVRHPGASVQAQPFLEQAAREAESTVAKAGQEGIAAALREAGIA